MKILAEATSELSLNTVFPGGRMIAEEVGREEKVYRQWTVYPGHSDKKNQMLAGTGVWRKRQRTTGNKATGTSNALKLEEFTCDGVQFRFDFLGKGAGFTSGN